MEPGGCLWIRAEDLVVQSHRSRPVDGDWPVREVEGTVCAFTEDAEVATGRVGLRLGGVWGAD